jgi:hypothetical protein
MTCLATRVGRLELDQDEPCDGRIRAHLVLEAGQPIPEGASRCPRCGENHLLIIIEEVVTARDEGTGGV